MLQILPQARMTVELAEQRNTSCLQLLLDTESRCARGTRPRHAFTQRQQQTVRRILRIHQRSGCDCPRAVEHDRHLVTRISEFTSELQTIDDTTEPLMRLRTGQNDDSDAK